MQCAAVSTQQDSIRTPPQKWLKGPVEPLGLVCRETCQGWAPGRDFFPPNILAARLGCGRPHSENWAAKKSGLAGVCSVTLVVCCVGLARMDKKSKLAKKKGYRGQILSLRVWVCFTCGTLSDITIIPLQLVIFLNEAPWLLISIRVPWIHGDFKTSMKLSITIFIHTYISYKIL